MLAPKDSIRPLLIGVGIVVFIAVVGVDILLALPPIVLGLLLLVLCAAALGFARESGHRVSPLSVYALLLAAVLLLVFLGSLLSLLGPGGAALLVVGLGAAFAVLSRFDRRKQRAEWELQGRCTECGYDLRESFDKCPECGAPIPAELERRRRMSAAIRERATGTAARGEAISASPSWQPDGAPLDPLARPLPPSLPPIPLAGDESDEPPSVHSRPISSPAPAPPTPAAPSASPPRQ